MHVGIHIVVAKHVLLGTSAEIVVELRCAVNIGMLHERRCVSAVKETLLVVERYLLLEWWW